MLKFPYGLRNFYDLITENYFYVDRTRHIRVIEDFGRELIFLRPRRFGKSLLLSMLENYYDIAKAEEFERLFGHLAIGKNPTPKHNQYFVMTWDFSAVSPEGDVREIRQALHYYVNKRIQEFAHYYQAWLPFEISIEPTDAQASFQSLLTAVKLSPYRLYLLIDEYDNFANELMMAHQQGSQSRYQALLSGTGAVKALFKAIKTAASGNGLERTFVTGVSPVVLSDMSSGYNVAEHIYLRREFNDLCGFLDAEIEKALTQIAFECDFSSEKVQQALQIMRTFYDGYRFSKPAKEFVYNPILALYFLKNFQQDCQFPEQLLDNNLAMDKGKLTYISDLPYGKDVIVQALNENPPLSLKQLASGFGVEDMLNSVKDTQFMVSLLYYFGILTLNGENEWKEMLFKVPNLVIRKLYVDKLKDLFLPEKLEQNQAQLLARQFYKTGDLQPICDFMEQHYFKAFDNRDYQQANELTIKTAFLTVLFDDTFYIMDSETELDRRYADLTMILRPEQRQSNLKNVVLEFKYVKLGKADLTGEKIREMNQDEIKAIPLVQQNFKEAKTQLLDYEKRLNRKYENTLQLLMISVVALGFERVVWENVLTEN
ncbi:AAA family ATPase [Candidatus Parabeggiatoa sp. HSG14]|uniref:AAA family ATPase n=1 Tax=Candidatus Parabeggiatoa sp. HSG14 TaxID=3055593 RepID=UPI0025A7EEBD|nr:AAA family ATPase [Thiotrichales bacterium HSG14]